MQGLIHPFNFLYSDFNYLFPYIIGSFSLYKLDLQHKSGIVRHQQNYDGDDGHIPGRRTTNCVFFK